MLNLMQQDCGSLYKISSLHSCPLCTLASAACLNRSCGVTGALVTADRKIAVTTAKLCQPSRPLHFGDSPFTHTRTKCAIWTSRGSSRSTKVSSIVRGESQPGTSRSCPYLYERKLGKSRERCAPRKSWQSLVSSPSTDGYVLFSNVVSSQLHGYGAASLHNKVPKAPWCEIMVSARESSTSFSRALLLVKAKIVPKKTYIVDQIDQHWPTRALDKAPCKFGFVI